MDWSSPGSRWPTEWQLSYGSGKQELGIKRYPDREPIVPSAVAALPGGSFAVVDPEHRRVVEVSAAGQVGRTIVEVPQVASDIAWDNHNHRLVVIANESKGQLIEVRANRAPSIVDVGRPIARLTSAPDGVYEGGPSPYDPLRLMASPLTDKVEAAREGLVLEDGSTLTMSSNRRGSRWEIARSGSWTLGLTFVGKNGPRKPALSLMSDMVVVGKTLVTAPLVGTFASGVDVRRQLLMIRVDLKTGALLGTTHLSQCGLTQDENVVSRITASRDGTIHQLCDGPHAVQLRREPFSG